MAEPEKAVKLEPEAPPPPPPPLEPEAKPETEPKVDPVPEPPAKADPEAPTAPPPPPTDVFLLTDLVLRVLVLASVVSAIAVTVTSHQTKVVLTPRFPIPVPVKAKFSDSPALVYFVVALSVAGLYSLVAALASVCVILNPTFSTKFLPYFLIWDVLILGILASATGAAGAVAYVGLKGNSHVGWNKVCNVYDKFCQYLASSVSLGLFASVLLVFLIVLSTLSLHKKIPK
ncbi:hypothetical protein MLD38_036113 [Melastoma candidum]|uniref:Uncharacterized protein n=1 Tax=Melastoma candidum TaxID=119954 RepID=A0ACB9LIN4_9MYRT|nr:hypothetical protein MLD38_036113 [Melastoma candidum]